MTMSQVHIGDSNVALSECTLIMLGWCKVGVCMCALWGGLRGELAEFFFGWVSLNPYNLSSPQINLRKSPSISLLLRLLPSALAGLGTSPVGELSRDWLTCRRGWSTLGPPASQASQRS